MQGIPPEVYEYLSTGDRLGQVAVEEAHPNVKETLNAPQTRQALLHYLAGDDPWTTPSPGFAVNAITFLMSGAKAEEAPFVRPLVMHRQPEVRVRAYDFLVVLAATDRAALLILLQTMLLDPNDMIRSAGMRHIRRTGTQGDLAPFLERWSKMGIAGRNDESRELAERLRR